MEYNFEKNIDNFANYTYQYYIKINIQEKTCVDNKS